jgi:hypothetical protein
MLDIDPFFYYTSIIPDKERAVRPYSSFSNSLILSKITFLLVS